MKAQIEPMQQPVRKVVGRFPKNSNPLVRLEQLNAFLKKFAPDTLINREGDFYPVKKVVGRPRGQVSPTQKDR
jgi:hypothetical protein